MELLILGFSTILLILYGTKGFHLYKSYKNTIFQEIFPNFLEYFFRSIIRKDCSTSSFLNNKIGKHRIHFSVIHGNEHEILAHFILIVYDHGIACIQYLDPKGALSGKTQDKYWLIHRIDKTYRIQNPAIETKKYMKRIDDLCKGANISTYCFVSNATDLSDLKATAYHYNELIHVLKSSDQPYISDEMINLIYSNLLKPIKQNT